MHGKIKINYLHRITNIVQVENPVSHQNLVEPLLVQHRTKTSISLQSRSTHPTTGETTSGCMNGPMKNTVCIPLRKKVKNCTYWITRMNRSRVIYTVKKNIR